MEDEKTKAYQILEQMFDIIVHNTRRPPRDCFNQLVRYLADCCRVQPLPENEHDIGKWLLPHTMPFLEAFYADPGDYLGTLFTKKGCANNDLGQIITPRPLINYINEQTIGNLDDGIEEPQLVLDPATGTARFLVEAARQFPKRRLIFFGVELDIDLYRAALVNMRLIAWHRPHYILRANALIVDLRPTSPNWQYANRWNPPDWKTEMSMEDGQTWVTWCNSHGHDIEDTPDPRRDHGGGSQDQASHQLRML